MVGHDDVGVQKIAAELGTANYGVFGVVSNLRVSQPERSGLGRVQGGIELEELLTGRNFRVAI